MFYKPFEGIIVSWYQCAFDYQYGQTNVNKLNLLFLLYNLGYVSIFFFCLTHLYIHHICSLQQSNLACYSTTASNLCSYSTKFKYLSIPLLEISFLVLYFTVVLILIRGIIKIHLLDLLSGVRKKKMLGTVLDNIKNCT